MIPHPIVKSYTFTINDRKVKFDVFEKNDTDHMFMPHTVLALSKKKASSDPNHPIGFDFDIIYTCLGMRIFDIFSDMFQDNTVDFDHLLAYTGTTEEEVVNVLQHLKSLQKNKET